MWGRLISYNSKVPDVDLIGEITLDKRKRPILDAIIQRDKLSSPHCKFHQDSTGLCYVTDLKSRNGTFINGDKLEANVSRLLQENDNVTLSIPSITHQAYDSSRHFAFRFQKQTEESQETSTLNKRRRKTPSKFDAKKKLVSSKRGVSVVSGTGKFSTAKELSLPEEYVAQLRFKPGARVLEQLQNAISNSNEEWLQGFLDVGGLSTILNELEMRQKKGQKNNLDRMISYNAVKVIHQIMQYPIGYKAILDTPNALGIISLGLSSHHAKLKSLIPLLLAAVACLSSEGHKEVIEAFNYFKKEKNERVRFKELVHSLQKDSTDLDYKTNAMRLINTIISKHENIENRTAMRQEFKILKILEIIGTLAYEDDLALNTELEGFQEEMEEDSAQATVNNADLSDPVAIAKALVSQTQGKALVYFTEIMQQLFSIPVNTMEGLSTWRLTEDVVRSATVEEAAVVTKKKPNKKLDFQTIRKMKKTPPPGNLLQEDQDALRDTIKSLQDENRQSNTKHLEEINNLVDKYSTEKKELQKSLEKEIATLRERLEAIPNHVVEIPIRNIPVPVQEIEEMVVPAPPPSDIAPPPPLPSFGGPPAPPGVGIARASYEDQYAFQPSVQMKKFYWTAILERDRTGTIWEDLDFKGIQYLEPIELEKLFGAKKKQEAKDTASTAVTVVDENPYHNIIDLKRSNNLGIMLKHFRMSPVAIKEAIDLVDESVLSSDKITQLYRNAPTQEEVDLLSQFPGDPTELGKSEQFLLQLVSIPDITERLELLHFRANFDDECEDLKHHYNTVIAGVEQVNNSTCLRQLCNLILAVGNFMNFGPWKAPAKGFKVDFLSKIGDTRSTDNSLTMMHYLAGLVADKHPDLLCIGEELSMVSNASRIPVAKLSSDVMRFNNVMSQIKRLLKKEVYQVGENRVKEVLLSFSLHAKRQLDILFDLKNTLDRLVTTMLCTYPFASTVTPEDGLALFSGFLLSFLKCHKDNEEEQASREMKERIAQKRAERESKAKQKKEASKPRPTKPKKGLMDGAFATLRGGGMKTFRARKAMNNVTVDIFSEEETTLPNSTPVPVAPVESPVSAIPTSAPTPLPTPNLPSVLVTTDSADMLEQLMQEME